MAEQTVALLESCRKRERMQTQFYRGLVALAQEAGDAGLSERFNELLADEQHHLSRVTARILELGGIPGTFQDPLPAAPSLEEWEKEASVREEEEVAWYSGALTKALDDRSKEILREILISEREHARALGGKWISA